MPDPTIRFAVGDPGGLSSLSWRVWVTRAGDAYLSCRDNYQELKVSLHSSGRWRVGLTTAGAQATSHLRPSGEDRAWDVWDRPEPTGGVAIGYRVLFLPSEFAVTPDLRAVLDWKKVEFVGVPTAGRITIATISINEPSVDMRIAGAVDQAAGVLPMPDGRRLQLTLHTEDLGEDFRRAIAVGYQQAVADMTRDELTNSANGRLFVTGARAAERFAVELNITRPALDPLRLDDSGS